MSDSILPGSTLGVLGSGQLGRMFTIAARRLGYRVHVFSPDYDTPTGQVADEELIGDYLDLDAIAEFAKRVSVVTFEFENVPAETTHVAAQFAPVRPGGSVLHTTQNRLREKTALQNAGLAVTPFVAVRSAKDLESGLQLLGCPAVLKTAAWGYDGKGQIVVRDKNRYQEVWNELNSDEAILEAFVDFERELSVVGARGQDGSFAGYGPMENRHANHILDVSICPANLPESVRQQANDITRTVFEQLDVVGVLCVEFFLTRDGKLLINELAPRPHNSGHLTVDAHATCQFEQQVRAVCGLPLGSAEQFRPAVMVNLLGDVWQNGEPNWSAALEHPDVKLHLYGKQVPRPGRKMGHLTALNESADKALQQALSARSSLVIR